jgi:hypothetical protein
MAADGRDTNHTETWRRSSRCTPGKNCVELARTRRDVVVRDSKSTWTLRPFDGACWTTFLAHCRTLD